MKEYWFFLLVFFCFEQNLFADSEPNPLVIKENWNQKIAQQAQDIVTKKCNSCHGAVLEHPKGKLVLDLNKLAKDPQYVIPGQPQNSLLFQVIDQGEMPPEESKTGQLVDAEKQTLFLWILLGSPAIEKKTSSSESPAESAATKSIKTANSVRFLGQLHPLLIHFPLALLLAATLAELLYVVQKKKMYASMVFFCLLLGMLGTVLSVVTGLCRAELTHFKGELSRMLFAHRILGISTAMISFLLAVLCIIREKRKSDSGSIWMNLIIRLFFLILFLLVLLTGHVGGSLIYDLPWKIKF